MAGVDLRSLATFDLGGRACRSGLAEAGEVVAVSGQPAPAALSAPVDVVLAGTPVSVWRVPDWQVADWTVVHLVLVARDGSEVPLAVHRELTGVLEIERDGASRVPSEEALSGGSRRPVHRGGARWVVEARGLTAAADPRRVPVGRRPVVGMPAPPRSGEPRAQVSGRPDDRSVVHRTPGEPGASNGCSIE
jgi:hypothetical protein